MVKSVSIIGLGKLGAPLAACLAARGFQVNAVDADPQKVDAINQGLAPVYEPGLAELIRQSDGRLRATLDAEAAVRDSEATFIVVGTPSEPGGGFSLRYVLPICETIGRALREKQKYHLLVLTSTVMPGSTGGEVKTALEEASGKLCGRDFGLCYSPEFIALGTVIRDFYHPDFLLIGESDLGAGEMLANIYQRVCKNSPAVARMNFINAEIAKLAVNTYLTTKISFANMLARLCEKLPGADVNTVTGALGLDTRIGPKYLKGTVSYGGPCFPRDNRALVALAAGVGSSSDIAQATERFNRAQIKELADLVRRNFSGDGSIGILGLAYKPNTNVVEESFGLLLAQELSSTNLPIVVYDPGADAVSALASYERICFAGSAQECIGQCDIVVVATPWEEFHQVPKDQWVRPSSPRVVIDCWHALNHLDETDGIRYVRLGRGDETATRLSPASLGHYATEC